MNANERYIKIFGLFLITTLSAAAVALCRVRRRKLIFKSPGLNASREKTKTTFFQL